MSVHSDVSAKANVLNPTSLENLYKKYIILYYNNYVYVHNYVILIFVKISNLHIST